MAYPSIWLAGLYDGKKYYGQSISAIKKEIKAVIKDVMRRIASFIAGEYGCKAAHFLVRLYG